MENEDECQDYIEHQNDKHIAPLSSAMNDIVNNLLIDINNSFYEPRRAEQTMVDVINELNKLRYEFIAIKATYEEYHNKIVSTEDRLKRLNYDINSLDSTEICRLCTNSYFTVPYNELKSKIICFKCSTLPEDEQIPERPHRAEDAVVKPVLYRKSKPSVACIKPVPKKFKVKEKSMTENTVSSRFLDVNQMLKDNPLRDWNLEVYDNDRNVPYETLCKRYRFSSNKNVGKFELFNSDSKIYYESINTKAFLRENPIPTEIISVYANNKQVSYSSPSKRERTLPKKFEEQIIPLCEEPPKKRAYKRKNVLVPII